MYTTVSSKEISHYFKPTQAVEEELKDYHIVLTMKLRPKRKKSNLDHTQFFGMVKNEKYNTMTTKEILDDARSFLLDK